jgi:hypothetical protein
MEDDLKRIEVKVDRLTEAIQKLIVFEERQNTQGERIGKCEMTVAVHDKGIHALERKVDMWINRGIGAWALATVVFFIFVKVLK